MSKRLFILTILFVIVIGIESILVIHLLTNSKEEPQKEKTVEEIKENEDIKKIRSMPYKHGQIIEISYTYNNPTTGGVDEIKFKRITSSYHITTYEKKTKDDKTKVKEYTVDQPEYIRILNYMAEYNIPAWSTLKDREDDKLDGKYKVLKLTFDDSAYNKSKTEAYVIGFNKEFPDGGHKIVTEFVNLLYNAVKDKNLLKQELKD